jgi:FKBP-type peptidyl-prolyl cis-trans isomerase
MTRLRLLLPLALLVSVLALAACGDDEDGGQTAEIPSGPSEAAPTTTTEAAPEAPEGGDPKDLENKPRVDVPKGDPPEELETEDIVKGKGKAAKKGDNVTVQYVGVLYEDGTEFDSSWDRNEPFPFELGAGMVIPGWDEGVAGMKEGGRRKLIIPADKAYGAQGQPPTIPPNAALVFVVDLEKVE